MATVLDTHRAVKALREADFSEAQAEAVAKLWRVSREADSAQLATKVDLERLERRLTIKLGGMIAAAVVIVGGARGALLAHRLHRSARRAARPISSRKRRT